MPSPDSLPPDFLPLARVLSHRAPRQRDLSLSLPIRRELTDLRARRRALSGIAAAWEQVIPPDLASRTRLTALRAGVLTVDVDDSSARYELDRLLRSGAEFQLFRLCPPGIRRVRVRLVSAAASENPRRS